MIVIGWVSTGVTESRVVNMERRRKASRDISRKLQHPRGPRSSQGTLLGLLPLLGLWLSPGSSVAQPVLSGSLVETVSGAQVSLEDAESNTSLQAPVLTWQSILSGQLVDIRPKATFMADTRMVLALDPSISADLSSGGELSSSSPTFAVRFQPELGLQAAFAPTQRLRWGVFARGQIHWNLTPDQQGIEQSSTTDPEVSNDPADPGTETSDPQTDTSSPLETTGNDSFFNNGLLNNALLRQLTRLPENTGWGEVGTIVQPQLGARTALSLFGSQRWLRPFACEGNDATLDPSLALASRDVQTDTLTLMGQADYQVHEGLGVFARGALRSEDSRPLAFCPETTAVAHRYYLVSPGAGVSFRRGDLTLGAQLGGTLTWDHLLDAPDSAVQGFDAKPTFFLTGVRRFGWGDLDARAGAEVTTLFGQATPSYNLVLESSGNYVANSEWGIRGGVSWIRTLPLQFQAGMASDGDSADSPAGASGGLRALGGRLEGVWTPRFWARAAMGYSLTAREAMGGSSTELSRGGSALQGASPQQASPPQRSTAEVSDFERVWMHAFYLHLTFTLDAGVFRRS